MLTGRGQFLFGKPHLLVQHLRRQVRHRNGRFGKDRQAGRDIDIGKSAANEYLPAICRPRQ